MGLSLDSQESSSPISPCKRCFAFGHLTADIDIVALSLRSGRSGHRRQSGKAVKPAPIRYNRVVQAIRPPTDIVGKPRPPWPNAPPETAAGRCRTTDNGSCPAPSSTPTGRMMIPASFHLGAAMEPIAGLPQAQTIAQGLTTIFRLS
jgi:hypothetical protein